MFDELPKTRRTAELALLRSGEVVLALFAVGIAIYFAVNGADMLRLFGLWDTINFWGSMVFMLWLVGYVELARDARIYKHEGELVPAAVFWSAILSIFVMLIMGAAGSIVEHAHVHAFDYEILYMCGILIGDVAWGSLIICLFLAQRRLNRAARVPHD